MFSGFNKVDEERRYSSAASYLPFAGQIGCDGGLAELRPTYGVHEDEVADSLRQLISKIPEKIGQTKGLSYEAHSYYSDLAAGFHVHIGLPPEMVHTKNTFHKAAVEYLVRCLDWYVSSLAAPLEINPKRRCSESGYGQPGDYRMSNYTLEYRTPGGILLRGPTLARGLLGACLLVAEHFVNRVLPSSRELLDLDKLTPDDLSTALPIPRPALIRHALRDPKLELLNKALPRIVSTLRGMPEYDKHSPGVEEFIRVVEARKLPTPNIMDNWRR